MIIYLLVEKNFTSNLRSNYSENQLYNFLIFRLEKYDLSTRLSTLIENQKIIHQ